MNNKKPVSLIERPPACCCIRVLAAALSLTSTATICFAATSYSSGNGLLQTQVSGCTPTEKADWIDQVEQRIYRRVLPRDCVLAGDRAPVFSWTEASSPARIGDYTVQIQRRDSATSEWQPLQRVFSAHPRVLLQAELIPGIDYRWRVEYNHGTVSSEWRRFQIAVDALGSALPTAEAAFARAAAREHPRLLPAGSSWHDVWSLAAPNGMAAMARELLVDAGKASSPLTAPDEPALKKPASFSNDAAYWSYETNVSAAAANATLALRKLAFAYHLAPDVGRADMQARILISARARLLSLARWSNGSTSHANADQANREIYLALATALDLLYEHLTPSERNEVTHAALGRMAAPVGLLREFDGLPYRSHEANTLAYTVRALALLAGEPGSDSSTFAPTWNAFTTLTSVWGEYDGATGNGVTYGWTDFLPIPETMYVLDVACGARFGTRSWFVHAVDNLMALTPPGQVGPATFGDSNESDSFGWYAQHAVRLHAALVPNASTHWYWKQSTTPLRIDEVPLQLLALALKRVPAPPAAPSDSFISADAGHVAFHTDITDRNGTRSSVFFRSSRFGAWNHSHADQNSFVFYSKGHPLLIGAGQYDYYGSPHHLAVTRATRYKNAITFDGGIGQAQDSATGNPIFSAEPYGVLLNAADTGSIAIATGDATAAYRRFEHRTQTWTPQLTTALRSIAFDKRDRVLLVYDDLESATPRQWEWNLHAEHPFESEGATQILPNGNGHACVSLHGAPARFTQSAGYGNDPAPSIAVVASNHGRYTQLGPSRQARTVMVIREDCATPLPELSYFASDEDAVRVSFRDGRTVVFRREMIWVTE